MKFAWSSTYLQSVPLGTLFQFERKGPYLALARVGAFHTLVIGPQGQELFDNLWWVTPEKQS